MNTTPWTIPNTRTPSSVVSVTCLRNIPASSSAHVTASARATRRKRRAGLTGSREGALDERGEEPQPVGAGTGEVLHGVLGVGHQPDDVAALVGDPGDVAQRAV